MPLSAQPDHTAAAPYALLPRAPAEFLDRLRADRRAECWVPAFEREWAAAREESRNAFSLSTLDEVIHTWTARLASAPAVDASHPSGRDETDFIDMAEARGRW
ncbi:DUF6247 family protein [Streptomyces sp. NPDC085529]|uniref:DUF6247 family protein n=1 Tax=Streptomyces sp. NPDC085529 TaxID=3365729 RepID=UPI0037CFBB67